MSLTTPALEPAIIAAKEVFWREGYEAASIQQIVQASGFNRYALYAKIGGKKELFLAALSHYHAERRAVFLNSLNDEDAPPLNAISDVLHFAIGEMVSRRAGCLLCNVAVETAQQEPDVGAQVDEFLTEIKWAYGKALERAAERGELNVAVSPDQGARMLVTLMLGLGVHARHGAEQQSMIDIVNATLALLRSKQPDGAGKKTHRKVKHAPKRINPKETGACRNRDGLDEKISSK